MSGYEYYHVDSFTPERFQGNPAGVILARELPTEAAMLQIAGEVQLECVFAAATPAEEYDYVVVYCTGVRRIPLCGHDTIALGAVLAQRGELEPGGRVRISTDVGVLEIALTEDGWVRMSQAEPWFGEVIPAKDLAAVLDLEESDFPEHAAPLQIASTGTRFLVAPVRDQSVLDALAPNASRLADFLSSLPDSPVGLYCWALSDLNSNGDAIRSRCFCPVAGLPEDPVTGSASGAFGSYLIDHGLVSSQTMLLWQGDRAARTGYVRVEIDGGDVRVSGQGTIVTRGELLG